MIAYNNIQRLDGIPFEDYLKLPGYSHSYLKSNVGGLTPHFNVTEKVRIGKIVDAIMTEPTAVDMSDPLYQACKGIAYELIKQFGDIYDACSKQATYTATMSMQGLNMPTKGRLDLLLDGIAVIDQKITHEKNIDLLIAFMGYENQLWHYCKMAKVDKGYLIIYSVPLRKAFVRKVDVSQESNSFWISKVLDFGEALNKPMLIESLNAHPDFKI